MTPRTLLLASAAAVMALGLSACGQREERAPVSDVAPSDVVAEPATSDAPDAAEAASDVAAVVPPPPAAEPMGPDPDEVAAAGDTRRRPSETPPPVTSEQPPQ
jgi:hypothetical protein